MRSLTLKPLDCKTVARDAEANPFPREETTPPVIKINLALFDKIFSHSRNKQEIYNLYSTYNLNPRTRVLFELSASKYPEVKRTEEIIFSFASPNLEKLKENFLKQFSSLF